ncbi:hypothetical protein BGW39_005146, partial [Mortierella sp. 14UC]
VVEAELSMGLEAAKAHMKTELRLQMADSNRIITARLASILVDILEWLRSSTFDGLDEVTFSRIRRTAIAGMGEFFALTSEEHSEFLDMVTADMVERSITKLEATSDPDF